LWFRLHTSPRFGRSLLSAVNESDWGSYFWRLVSEDVAWLLNSEANFAGSASTRLGQILAILPGGESVKLNGGGLLKWSEFSGQVSHHRIDEIKLV